MASIVNTNTKLAKRLSSISLRYWVLEYLRRQPKENRFRALILRFIKDRIAALLLVEVRIDGLQLSYYDSWCRPHFNDLRLNEKKITFSFFHFRLRLRVNLIWFIFCFHWLFPSSHCAVYLLSMASPGNWVLPLNQELNCTTWCSVNIWQYQMQTHSFSPTISVTIRLFHLSLGQARQVL